MPRIPLYFGVEIELLVRPREILLPYLGKAWDSNVDSSIRNNEAVTNKQEKNRGVLREALAFWLSKMAYINTGTVIHKDYKQWTVVDEPSLDEIKGFCKSSLPASPVLTRELIICASI